MGLSPRLDIRQTQSLVMTPQLQQAIKLLQLSNIELSTFVEQEMERNPLLERDDGPEGGPDDTPPPLQDERRGDGEVTLDAPHSGDEAPLDVDYDNTFNTADTGGDGALTEWGGGNTGGRQDFDESDFSLEQTLAREVTLRDHLTSQLNLDLADAADRLIGLHLFEMLDESGYLVGDLDEAAATLGCDRARLDAVLARLQRFDPPGIFARSLAECLGLQLRDLNRLDPAMQCLLDHLELLARRELNQLMKLCAVDAEDMAEMIAEIKALNPKPALVFDHTTAQPVVPDVLMRAGPGGDWLIELNSDTLPRVLVNTRYYSKVTKGATKDDKAYLSERFQSANWLVKSLHQRATTILKVATELVRQQDAFFLRGVQYLRPLVLRDIATAIGMHESTVSRVTANKYMATPRGIYELKYFFTQSIASNDGAEAHSAEAVRHRIKTLIDGESPKDVLSDEKLVVILRAEGVEIARRTVAKYREALHLASSAQRRREKMLGV